MAIATLRVREERFAYRKPFQIAGHLFTETTVVVAEIDDGGSVGRGEAAGVYYLGDNAAAMRAAILEVRPAIENGAGREQLLDLLPPGGARCALDCALWDLESKRAGVPVATLAGVGELRPLPTTVTIGAADPATMAAEALDYAPWPLLKLKLTGDITLDIARVRAVRLARPDCWLGVDANQGYERATLGDLIPVLVEADVRLLEQPLRRGTEADLDGFDRALPFAADESICCLSELGRAQGRFDVVNIKLDKCGGLTEGLAIARACRERGLDVMVGNMMGTSLSMAPSMIVGQLCDIVDLDGPVFLTSDRGEESVTYQDGMIDASTCTWGQPAPPRKRR